VPSNLLPSVIDQVTGKNEAVTGARVGRISIHKAHIVHAFGDTDDARQRGLPSITGVCSSKLYDAYAHIVDQITRKRIRAGSVWNTIGRKSDLCLSRWYA
jgi:hypothetical protein